MGRFFRGVNFALKGISCFYGDRSLWKFTFWPWTLLLLFYAGSFWLTLRWAKHLALSLSSRMTGWPEFLRTLLEGSLTFLSLLLVFTAAVTLLSTLFEVFGALFFDKMIEKFEEKYYGRHLPAVPLKKQFLFTIEGTRYGVKSLLIFAVLFIGGLFIPFVPVFLAIVMGIRMAYALVFPSGFLRGDGIQQTERHLLGQRWEIAGFGITLYLLQLIPLFWPFLLPGMLLGGAMLYNGTTPQEHR